VRFDLSAGAESGDGLSGITYKTYKRIRQSSWLPGSATGFAAHASSKHTVQNTLDQIVVSP
jgi:hypothetical protein